MRGILFFILGPIIFVLGHLVRAIYAVLFGWWLDPRDARKADARFNEDIRQKLPFLFTKYGATVVPTVDPPPRAFDAAFVTLSVGNLNLRFLRARGDLAVEVSPVHLPAEWHELGLAAMVTEYPQGIGPRAKLFDLNDVARLLRSKWEELNTSFSAESYPTAKKRLEAIYDLSADDLWQGGITLPKRFRRYPVIRR